MVRDDKRNKEQNKFDIKKNKKKFFKSKKTENHEVLKDTKEPKNKKSVKFYYSLLTIALLIFLSQVVFSAILNITKSISYQAKLTTIKKSKAEAEAQNKKLKKELKHFSTSESLEAIARNNLKMAGDDEVLIIINEIKKQKTEEEQTKTKKGFFHKLGKDDR